MSHLRQSLCKNGNVFKCVETNECKFTFEWRDLGYGASNFSYTTYRGKHYTPISSSERNSYILSKIEELRSKGLDVSWFDKNKEKYLKMENKKKKQ